MIVCLGASVSSECLIKPKTRMDLTADLYSSMARLVWVLHDPECTSLSEKSLYRDIFRAWNDGPSRKRIRIRSKPFVTLHWRSIRGLCWYSTSCPSFASKLVCLNLVKLLTMTVFKQQVIDVHGPWLAIVTQICIVTQTHSRWMCIIVQSDQW